MTNKITYHPEVYHEVIAIVEWYDLRVEGLGLDFLKELNVLLNFISENPSSGTDSGNMSRIARMQKFPYLIEYYISGEEIRVINIIHAVRDPSLRKRNARKRRK